MNRVIKLGHPDFGREVTLEYLCRQVNAGWTDIIIRLVNDLFDMGWDGEVWQVKEKFGYLRFYVGRSTDRMIDRIRQAEDESSRTSEFSGLPGKIRPTPWRKCLTEEEWKIYQATEDWEEVKRLAQKLNEKQSPSTEDQQLT